MDRKFISYALRFALLVLLPFMLGALVLPHTQYIVGQELNTPNDAQGGSPRAVTYAFVHNGADSFVTNKINSLFPLAEYLDFPPFVNHGSPTICFADNGSTVILPDNSTTTPNYRWDVVFNNQTSVGVRPFSTNCTQIVLGGQYSYEWKLSQIQISSDSNISGTITFVPQTSTYTRMVMDYGILQGLVLVPVFYLLIVYPVVGLKRKILEGIEAQ
ncbi:MAG: hypothetical protein WC861_04320 [Candidatus Micrarchaeia archaeon]